MPSDNRIPYTRRDMSDEDGLALRPESPIQWPHADCG